MGRKRRKETWLEDLTEYETEDNGDEPYLRIKKSSKYLK